jgi:hypothetical protein
MMREYVVLILGGLAAGALLSIAAALWRFLGWMPELVTALRVIAAELTKLRELQDPSVPPRVPAGLPYRWSGGR